MDNPSKEKIQLSTNLMREKRKTWSLQNDVELLKNLECFSQNLIKKTHLFMDSLDKFQSEISWTSVDVKTLSNNFEGISESQFVEKRVYDEEDMICEEEKKNYSTPSSDKNKLHEALQTCAKELQSRFEAVKITMNDSEEDNIFNKGEVVLIPKDRYKSRILPELKDFYSEDQHELLNDLEDTGEVVFNDNDDEDDHIDHYDESSSIDQVDNLFQKNNCFTNADSEIKSATFREKNENFSTGNVEEGWKESNDHINEILNEHVKKPELPLSTENFSSNNFHNTTPGESRNSAIVDEIKNIFGDGNIRGQAKLPVFHKMKNETYREVYKEDAKVHQANESSSNKENDYTKPSPFRNNEKSVFLNTVIVATNNADEYKEESMCEESILPNVQTEVLHSFAKSRAKIKGKRRLPTRRPRNIFQNGEVNIIKQEPRDSNILSPSTDEEDLFVIPHVNIPKETSSDYLFGMPPTLFSPSSSTEVTSKDLYPTKVLKQKECNEVGRKKERQEVEIKKSFIDSEKRSNGLFSDWDSFNSEESDLFSSLDRKVRKTKLFDDFDERAPGKTIKNIDDDDDDDDLFSFSDNNASNSASSLFSSSTDNFISYPYKANELFVENKNNSSTNLFSNISNDDFLFGSSDGNKRGLNLSSEPDNIQSLSGVKIESKDKKIQSISCPNPLMDTEDNLFD